MRLLRGLSLVAGLAAIPMWEAQSAAGTYDIPAGQSATVSGQIADGTTATQVVLTGGGSLGLINAANSYTGGTFVQDGSTLQINADAELGATTGGVTLGDALNPGTLNFTNTTSFTSARVFVLEAGGGIFNTGSVDTVLSGIISGTGSLTVTGGGALTLTGVNTYSGGTFLSSGTLAVAADTSLGNASALLTLNGGVLQFTDAATLSRGIVINTGGGAFNTNGYAAILAGNVTGAGTLTKLGAGSLTLDGADTLTGGATVTAGTLQVGDVAGSAAVFTGDVSVQSGANLTGGGTILGSVTNLAGTVTPGIAGAASSLIVTNYTQASGGTLAPEVSTAGTSLLTVTNSASLAGRLLVTYSGNLSAGSYEILKASSLTGNFTTVTENGLSLALQQSVSYTGDSVDVILKQLSTLPEQATIFSAANSVAIDSAQAANDTILSRLVETRTDALADDMRLGNSDLHGATTTGGNWPYGAWFKASGGFGNTNGSASAPGYGTSGGGFMAGLDGQLDKGFAVGLAAGYDRSSVNEHSGAHGTISTPRLAAYAGWWRDIYAIDATIGYGSNSFSASRPIAAIGETAASTYSGSEFTGALQGSATFKVHNVVLLPEIGAKYALVTQKGFSESGADIYDLTGSSDNTNSLRPFIGATAKSRLYMNSLSDWAFLPEFHVAYEREVLSTTRSTTVQAAGDSADFVMVGVPASRSDVDISAGLSMETSRSLSLFAGYEAIKGSGIADQLINVGLRYRIGA